MTVSVAPFALNTMGAAGVPEADIENTPEYVPGATRMRSPATARLHALVSDQGVAGFVAGFAFVSTNPDGAT